MNQYRQNCHSIPSGYYKTRIETMPKYYQYRRYGPYSMQTGYHITTSMHFFARKQFQAIRIKWKNREYFRFIAWKETNPVNSFLYRDYLTTYNLRFFIVHITSYVVLSTIKTRNNASTHLNHRKYEKIVNYVNLELKQLHLSCSHHRDVNCGPFGWYFLGLTHIFGNCDVHLFNSIFQN